MPRTIEIVSRRHSTVLRPEPAAFLTQVQCRLKYCTSRSCFSAAARDLKVPRLRRLPVFGLTLREYSRYSPDCSLRIMDASSPKLCWHQLRSERSCSLDFP